MTDRIIMINMLCKVFAKNNFIKPGYLYIITHKHLVDYFHQCWKRQRDYILK